MPITYLVSGMFQNAIIESWEIHNKNRRKNRIQFSKLRKCMALTF